MNTNQPQMTDTQKLEFLLSKLQETVDKQHCYDKYGDDYSCCGDGSYDDAFSDGEEYGRVEFARHLLHQLRLEVNIFHPYRSSN
jgi:hypothetical protein